MSGVDDFISRDKDSLGPYKVLGWVMFAPGVFLLSVSVILAIGSLLFFRDGFIDFISSTTFISTVIIGTFLIILSLLVLKRGYDKNKINRKTLKNVILLMFAMAMAFFIFFT